jgi:hypothetical protein
LEDHVEDGEIHELTRARARDRRAYLIELRAQKALPLNFSDSARDRIDVFTIRERQPLVRIVLTLEDDLGWRNGTAMIERRSVTVIAAVSAIGGFTVCCGNGDVSDRGRNDWSR